MKVEGTEKNFNKNYLLLVNFIYYINQKCCMTIFRMGKTKEITQEMGKTKETVHKVGSRLQNRISERGVSI